MIPRFLKLGLFIYECVKTVLWVFTLAFMIPVHGILPFTVFTASGTIFPIMTLFIWIDINRFRNYLPLYIAGKSIGFFVYFVSSVISGLTEGINFKAGFILAAGNLFALGIAIFLLKERSCE